MEQLQLSPLISKITLMVSTSMVIFIVSYYYKNQGLPIYICFTIYVNASDYCVYPLQHTVAEQTPYSASEDSEMCLLQPAYF